MKAIKELRAGGMAQNRYSRRYLLPKCYQNERYRNERKPSGSNGLSRGGISPIHPMPGTDLAVDIFKNLQTWSR